MTLVQVVEDVVLVVNSLLQWEPGNIVSGCQQFKVSLADMLALAVDYT